MKKIITRITLLAGVAVLFGAASSAQAQCSSGYYAPPVVYNSCQPQQVYGNYGYSQVYDYGYSQPTRNTYAPSRAVTSYRTQTHGHQHARPRVVSTFSFSRQPVYQSGYSGYGASSSCSSGYGYSH